jgi:hypothetical protein
MACCCTVTFILSFCWDHNLSVLAKTQRKADGSGLLVLQPIWPDGNPDPTLLPYSSLHNSSPTTLSVGTMISEGGRIS